MHVQLSIPRADTSANVAARGNAAPNKPITLVQQAPGRHVYSFMWSVLKPEVPPQKPCEYLLCARAYQPTNQPTGDS